MSRNQNAAGSQVRVVFGVPVEILVAEVYSSIACVVDYAECGSGVTAELKRFLQGVQTSDRGTSSPVLLPLLVCEGGRGEARDGTWSAAAWVSLYITGKLLDDLADGDAGLAGQYRDSVPRLLDLATGFWAVAELCLCELPTDVYLDIARPVHKTILRMVNGQHREHARPEGRILQASMEAAGEKSGSFFELAAHIGARCGTTDRDMIARLREFGYEVGVMVQLVDDLKDFRQSGREGDLAKGHLTLPTAYALEVAQRHEREELQKLLMAATRDASAEDQARQMITGLGAELFVITEIALHRRRALSALQRSGGDPKSLQKLMNWLTVTFEGGVDDNAAG